RRGKVQKVTKSVNATSNTRTERSLRSFSHHPPMPAQAPFQPENGDEQQEQQRDEPAERGLPPVGPIAGLVLPLGDAFGRQFAQELRQLIGSIRFAAAGQRQFLEEV